MRPLLLLLLAAGMVACKSRDAARIDALEQRIDALEQRIAALEKKPPSVSREEYDSNNVLLSDAWKESWKIYNENRKKDIKNMKHIIAVMQLHGWAIEDNGADK